ncbi:hypothetical protein [Stieleria varia]|uniref:Uncharacterized protein n=1 Tax=Stieleria varia TaxID=2528005 RepID=A0A5C6B882_9BACT|nr:hypothetical protein [Stieleria varia]TWU07651.1 hypothetical protein Pla52n_02240 [Stieleria varia]
MLPKPLLAVLLAVLISAALWRAKQNRFAEMPDQGLQRPDVLQHLAGDPLQRPSQWQRVDLLRYDATAPVVISVGADQQPGQKGINDDWRTGDTEIDNRKEIGATFSDDVCLGPLDDGYERALSDPRSLVVSYGTYTLDSNALPASPETDRYLIHGRSEQGKPWNQLVVLDSHAAD